jgi:hypothetical protein
MSIINALNEIDPELRGPIAVVIAGVIVCAVDLLAKFVRSR